MKIRELRKHYVKFLIAFFVIGITAGLIGSVSLRLTSGDFDVYYAASRHYLAKAPVYIFHSGIEEFKYSPLFALFFSPLAMLNKISALYIWSILNILSFYFMFYLFYRMKLIAFNRMRDFWIIICLLALTGRYIFANIKIGQVNFLLCLLMVLAMYFEIKKKDFWSALFLSLSVMIKFFPLLFLAYFVLRRRFKIAGYTVLLTAVLLLLPGLYSGIGRNFQYLREWLDLLKVTPAHMLYSSKNYSLLSFFSWNLIARYEGAHILDLFVITKKITPEVYRIWAFTCFSLFSLYFVDVLFKKERELKKIYLDYAGLFACMLLFNPLSYLNALVFLIVPYFFILRALFYAELNKRWAGLVSSLILLCFTFTMVYNKAFFNNVNDFNKFLEYKFPMWTIIFVYLTLILLKMPAAAHRQARSGN